MTARRTLWAGTVLGFVSAMLYGLNVAFVPIVYEAGGNIQAVNLVRPLFFGLFALAFTMARGKSLALAWRWRFTSYLVGLLFVAELYGVHSAIKFIPVGLAILIVYTYPIAIALIAAVMGKERLTPVRLAGMFLAFAGLALALSAGTEALDWRGVAWSLLAAAALVAIVLISEKNMAENDFGAVMTHSMMMTSVAIIIIVLAGAEIAWPQGSKGILALGVATIAYTGATTLLFLTIQMIGPVRFAIIDNTAPLWAMGFGFILLGERLTSLQLVGVGIVVVSVIGVQVLLRKPDSSG